MTCAEFQRDLPDIFEGGGSLAHEDHLRTCHICADLVSDLRYIAEQAKLLVPMEDPSPKVWEGITKSLEREGLVKPAPARRGLLAPHRASWGLLLSLTAVLLFAIGFLYFHQTNISPVAGANANQQQPVSAGAFDPTADDQQILQQVEQRDPSLRPTYETNLKNVNAYISDAKQSIAEDPDDTEARQYLIQAMEQKAMLYQMATRSSE
jgi:hypothetical protein